MAQSLAAALDVARAVLLQPAATIKGALFLSHLALQLSEVLEHNVCEAVPQLLERLGRHLKQTGRIPMRSLGDKHPCTYGLLAVGRRSLCTARYAARASFGKRP